MTETSEKGLENVCGFDEATALLLRDKIVNGKLICSDGQPCQYPALVHAEYQCAYVRDLISSRRKEK